MSARLDKAANFRLQQHLMRGVTRRRNYSPDTTTEMLKAGKCGPHTVQITAIFTRWAAMWQADVDALEGPATGSPGGGFEFQADADDQWRENMRQADAEVDRYLDANKLPRVA